MAVRDPDSTSGRIGVVGFFEDADHRGWPFGQTPRVPPWSRVPHEELPATVGIAEVVAVGRDVAVVVSGFEVYSTGFTFLVRAVRHPEATGHDDDLAADMLGFPPGRSERGPRFELRYDDGRRASSDGADHQTNQGRAVVLQSVEGSGSADRAEQRMWAWPVPRSGDLTFSATWPAREIPESTLELSGTALRAAAAAARPVFPERGAT